MIVITIDGRSKEKRNSQYCQARHIQQNLLAVTLCGRSYVNMGVLAGAGSSRLVIDWATWYCIAALAEILLRPSQGLRRPRDACARTAFSYHEASFGTAAANLFNRSTAIMSGASFSTIQVGRCCLGTGQCKTLRREQKGVCRSCKVFHEGMRRVPSA